MEAARLVGCDAEWDGDFFMMSFAHPDGRVRTVHGREAAKDVLYDEVTRGKNTLALHNGRSDWTALGHYPANQMFDSLVLSWLHDENEPHGLKYLSEKYLGRKLEDPLIRHEGQVYWRTTKTRLCEAPLEEVEEYNREDARATRDLALYFWDRLTPNLRNWYQHVEQDFDKVLYEMEQNGIRLDVGLLAKERYALQSDVDRLRGKVYGMVGYDFNLNSGPVLGKVLFTDEWEDKARGQVGWFKRCEHHADAAKCKVEGCAGPKPKQGWVEVPRKGLGLRSERTTDGGRQATDDAALEPHAAHPAVAAILDYKDQHKILTTYVEGYPRFMRGERLYGRFNATGTKTGRISASDPNTQNQPSRGELGARIRSLFVPEPGNVLVVGDLDQLELRILAGFANERVLLDAFERGEDVHLATAAAMGIPGKRAAAKGVNYALGYGAGPPKLAFLLTRAGEPTTRAQARKLMDKHNAALPSVAAWKEQVWDFCYKNGFVYTAGLRKRRLPGIWSSNPSLRGRAERQAVNSVIQGSAADVVKLAQVYMFRAGLPGKMLLQVHDEWVFECRPEEAEVVSKGMVDAVQAAAEKLRITVPLTITPKAIERWAAKND